MHSVAKHAVVMAIAGYSINSRAQVSPSPHNFPALRHFSTSHRIEVSNSGNQTILYIDPIFVRPELSFSAAYSYSGTEPDIPATVMLSFATGRRAGYDFERNRILTLVLDQMTQLPLGIMEYDVKNNMIRLFVPLDTFLQVVNAQSVSGQIGDAAFQLDSDAQEALRDLASRMAPGPSALNPRHSIDTAVVGTGLRHTSSAPRPPNSSNPDSVSGDDGSARKAKTYAELCGVSGHGCQEPGTVTWQSSTTLERTMSLSIRDKYCTTGGYAVEFRVVAPDSLRYSITRQIRSDSCDEVTDVKFPDDFLGQYERPPSLFPGTYRWMGIVNHEIAVEGTFIARKQGSEIILESPH